MLIQAVQIVGAVAILIAFAGSQFQLQRPDSYTYIVLNLVGGVLLLVAALSEQQWGFLMLETAWSVVSAWSLMGKLRKTVSVA